jgi:hypothetical protein
VIPTVVIVHRLLLSCNTSYIHSWIYEYTHIYEDVSKSFRTVLMTKYTLTFGITHWEATQRVMAAKLTTLTHKIAIQLHLVAESSTICSFRSRRPVRKLLDTPSSVHTYIHTYIRTYVRTYIHTYVHTYVLTYLRTYTNTHTHTHTHTYIHTYLHTYIHTYIHSMDP